MAYTGAFHCSIAFQAFMVLFVLSVFAADVKGGDGCPHFSCGHLRHVRSPFRRRGDPRECGSQSHELVCSDSKAKILITNTAYYVATINYTSSSFWVLNANLDTNSSCPLPYYSFPRNGITNSDGFVDFYTPANWACFVNCSRAIANNSWYKSVACLSANNSHVYVLAGSYSCTIEYLQPSCRSLNIIPFGGKSHISNPELQNASYHHIMEFIRMGFMVEFPFHRSRPFSRVDIIDKCVNNSTSYFKKLISDPIVMHWFRAIFFTGNQFISCLYPYDGYPISHELYLSSETIIYSIDVLKFLFGLCRFVLAPLAVLIFLAHKYWKTRIIIDAVEKFLRMQQMIGPVRYAYTDITAITGHFRDKLGQGGYGSVYKGVLLPGDVHVAVKMLEGNSNCNGEDFISEVSTLGRIHHVNVVRLVGFCSEEMRRALVYEYMPEGSLDKYIFSAEKIFSWDKLIEIALGIARGINYLHQGCEMQIVHFDIKPHNILLDGNFVPKVADFGLAKLYPKNNSFVPLSVLRGTVGYIAPEMISRSFGVISSKSDVYSFGMLLLEMAGGRRNSDPNAVNSSQAYYPSWVYDQLKKQEVREDEISTAASEMHELERKLCLVGLCCIQMKSHNRPTMSDVIDMLEGGVDGMEVPSRPFFCDDEDADITDSYRFFSEVTAISEEEVSEDIHTCN
ncbi:LEAF RUST 10 DISEASE-RESISTANCEUS RECEPTOR-LIKE PROTEIN KINASE-like 2.4 [Lolium perenne]|uniref:LEAF RUST 10 DISEASE-RESISTANCEUS RECEPTOR-LIKE PROTEIN KINASE-like 2.4 n=1 Tax=Lolium perenne TaxID=4522 RepID=UPI003A99453C